MADINYKGLFQGWEVAVAKKLVYDFKEKWRCLDIDGFDDLLQECLTHWLFVKDKYDPKAEASEKTFMGRVIRNRLSDIVKEHERQCRRGSQNTVSLDEPLFDEDDSPTLLDTIAEDPERTSGHQTQAEIRIYLSHAYQKLTKRQKRLCALLGEKDMSVNEASKALKTHKCTLYREIESIKEIFREEKLHEYLE